MRFFQWLALALLFAASLGSAGETTGWRKDWTGRYPEATPPTEWAKDKNVVWSTALPAWSNANPVLCGERLFICAEPDKLVCVAKADGKVLWQQANPVFESEPEAERAKAQEQFKAAQPDI